MSTDLVTAEPGATLRDALDLMTQHRIRHLLVVESGALYGLVTDRDLRFVLPSRLVAAAPEQHSEFLDTTSIRTVCITSPRVVPPDAVLREAAQMMHEGHLGCLPVVEHRRPVGILTAGDFVRWFAQHEYR